MKKQKTITGAYLRKLREEAGLTQAELGEILDYRWQEISAFENERRPIPRAVEIILLHVPLNRLVDAVKKKA